MTQQTETKPAESSLEEARATAARWESEKATAAAELADLEARTGAEVLADPDGAPALARARSELRERVAVAGEAVAQAGERLRAAERVYLLDQAEKLQPTLERATRALAVFDGRTAELVAALQAHTGGPGWKMKRPELSVPFDLDRREALAGPVASLQRAQQALRLAADGLDPFTNDPFPLVPDLTGADLPATVWGPDAVLPLPRYVQATNQAARRRAEHESELQEAHDRLAEASQRAAQIKVHLGADLLHEQQRRDLLQELAVLEGKTAGPQVPGSSIPEMRATVANLEHSTVSA